MSTPPPAPRPQFWPLSKEFLTALRESTADRFQIAAALLDQGVDINGLCEISFHRGPLGRKVSREQITALYDAAKRADYDAVQFLLNKGADVKARNRTGMSIAIGPFPYHNAIDTLCGLDSMRTSEDERIVLLAEEKFGAETDEDYVGRRDAFDSLVGYHPYNSTKLFKPQIDKVISGQKKKSAARKRSTPARKKVDGLPDKQKRYGLRKRDPEISYI